MKGNKLGKKHRVIFTILICVLTAAMIVTILTVRKSESEKIRAEGMMSLSNIAGQVGSSLYRSECLLDSVAMQVEQIISMGSDTDKLLDEYICYETVSDIGERSENSCFSAYVAYNDKLYIVGFLPDEDFVLDERSWYIGAKTRMGAVNVSEPYIDANTGEMCYTLSKLLSDGSTVVGLDFNLNSIQQYIEEMDSNGSGTSFIVNENGTIVGHSNAEYVGRDYRELEFYNELINKVYMLYGDTFTYKSDGDNYDVFSDKIDYDWYLAVCVKNNLDKSLFSGGTAYILLFMVLFSAAVIILVLTLLKKNAAAEKELAYREQINRNLNSEFKRSISKIINTAECLSHSGDSGAKSCSDIVDSAREISGMLDNIEKVRETELTKEIDKRTKADKKGNGYHRIKIAFVMLVLIATAVFTLIFNTMTHAQLSDAKILKEAQLYQSQVKEWTVKNKTVLDVISDSISAQPDFIRNYDNAVAYLDSIVSNYEDISVAYLCNPEWEHTVIMNNGWEPDASWHVEERQWYIDTMVSDDNFNISAPYMDEQTGFYCTTLSRIVYDSKGNFIGVLGIDYYLDKLTAILDESYTDSGYAFLTDIDGNILNHPNEEYQMKPGYSVNAADTCYRDALLGLDYEGIIFADYDGVQKCCYATKEELSGFNVFVVIDMYEALGNALYSDWIYIGVFLLCIIIVNVVMTSITRWQRKVNKELKEAADNAINAGKAKNNFLANMSHEIRTPINAVLGMNEMIMRESSEPPIVEYASNIQSAGRTLLSIINDILDFSKIESGKMEIVPVEYDVSSLVNDIVNMVKSRAEKKQLKFISEIDENIPAVLYGDDVRLRQIITNILTNAVKYTPAGHVRLKMNVLQVHDNHVQLEVSVTDTGMGIKEEDMNKLFTSFQRLDQEKNRNIEGTGLGITIVQRLLNMMGSELNVSSIYGVGSTFSFVIEQKIINPDPMGNYQQRLIISGQQSQDVVIKTAPDLRVLIVDDNETNLLVAKNLLKRTQVKTETASSGAKCIELLEKNIYDIVFLDHMMPEMDGMETLAKIKEKQLAVGTVFIALTANAIHGAKQFYLDAGFDDYLSKPFSGHDIEKCLFSHVEHDMIKRTGGSSADTDEADRGQDELVSKLDITKALAACGNDTEAYLDAVYEFCENERCNDLELDFSVKDLRSYRSNLKVVEKGAHSTGLTELEKAAQTLADAADRNDTDHITANHHKFMNMYRDAVNKLESTVKKQLNYDD